MDFQLQMQENVRMIIFREKERTNNESLIFCDIKVVTEREQLYYWILSTKN